MTMELMKTIDPPPCAFIGPITSCVNCRVPNTLTSKMWRHLSRSTSSNSWNASGTNALLTSASIRPKRSTAVCTSRRHCSTSVMSVGAKAT